MVPLADRRCLLVCREPETDNLSLQIHLRQEALCCVPHVRDGGLVVPSLACVDAAGPQSIENTNLRVLIGEVFVHGEATHGKGNEPKSSDSLEI